MDSGAISVALLALVLILLYILSTGITLVGILKNDIKSLIYDVVNFADRVFNVVKNGNDVKLNQLEEHVKVKLLKVNETFTKILLNITKVLLNYISNTTITNSSLISTSELNISKTLIYLNVTN